MTQIRTLNRPSSSRYVVRVRLPGYRHYEIVGKPTKSYRAALMRMANAFTDKRYKRGDVLLVADWYDPVVLTEIHR